MDKIIERLNGYFEKLVPVQGKADTVAGEIVRALSRIGYRFYNDGDCVGVDYGCETCNPAARYLMDKLPDELGTKVSTLWADEINLFEDTYEETLMEIIGETLDWLDTTELDKEPNTEDMHDWKTREDDDWGRNDEDDEY